MTNASPRKRFLDLIAPRWRIPQSCPEGNNHNEDLCMGSKVASDLGRRYFYCNTKGRKSPQCASGEDARSPVLPEVTCNHLRSALRVFDQATASGLNFQSATAQGRANFEAQERSHREAEAQTRREAEECACLEAEERKRSDQIELFIYLTASDTFIKQTRSLRNGSYSIYSDPTLCNLLDFLNLCWSVYDRFREEFIPIPTFSSLAVLKDEFLVLHRSSFADKDCKDLDELLAELKALGLHKPRHLKRRAREEEEPGPSKRCKPNLGDEILDWGDL